MRVRLEYLAWTAYVPLVSAARGPRARVPEIY